MLCYKEKLNYCDSLRKEILYNQSRVQSPQASRSAGGPRERLWGNGIVTTGIQWLTVASFVTVNKSEQPIKKMYFFFYLPWSLSWRPPADQEE